MGIVYLLFLLIVMVGCFIAPAPASAAWQPTVSVCIATAETTAAIAVKSGTAVLKTEEKAKPTRTLRPGMTVTVSTAGSQLTADGKPMRTRTLLVTSADEREPLVLTVNGKAYRGALRTDLDGLAMNVINIVRTEDYLQGVVPQEMPSAWPRAAVEAQAVAARTFALQGRGRHSADGYDLCATTHCQSYGGIAAEDPGSTTAIAATYGEVLTYKGQLISAVFHTDSGGSTDSSRAIWGTDIAYLQPAKELQTKTQPWKRSWNTTAFVATLSHKKNIGTLKKIQLTPLTIGKSAKDRSASGRVMAATFLGTKGTLTLSGNELRSLFHLPSTLFDLKLDGDVVICTGYGAGHGLGLSQWGAKAFAEAGKDYKAILAHYYKGTTLKELYRP
ncbi:SpoIID/LytB domain-containing protein [uncultured Selenomonas sp.]|uniref:SpoIID/LytB domain-containing protein n=1 Tax=uncultured Selenomonas sp. TaxID=159275 RepID=UPI0025F264E3|nr:SpoIID/LytB domain-containing protein [uncultured Selenomonas sp.]